MSIDSPRVRGVAVAVVALVLVFLFAKRMRDSADEATVDAAGRPRFGSALRFEATAYCKGETTAAGVGVRAGVAAADPALLPLGSVVRVEAPVEKFSGVWTVLDTGPQVSGRELDLYVWSCHEALAFGRQQVRVTILRLGWDPKNSAPTDRGTVTLRDTPRPAPAAPAAPSPG
jgi:3D (Asp-Asp-Asp) domain-containing protein